MRALVLGVCALFGGTASAKQQPPPSRSSSSPAVLSCDVTVLAFASEGCAPCRRERPMLGVLEQQLAGDARVRVVVVSLDDRRGASTYTQLFGAGDVELPRLAVVDRALIGLERKGAPAGETGERFVREVSAAVASVEAGAPRPPSPLWQSYRRPPAR